MTGAGYFSEAEVLLAVPRLTLPRLQEFVTARIILPVQQADVWVYRRIDLARIELLCDLTEEFDLDDDALGLVIGLVDQLHEARRELRAICAAVAEEPSEVRNRIGGKLTEGA